MDNAGTVLPAQIVNDVPKLNVGVIFGLTVTTNVAGKTHKPGVGVNTYAAAFWSSITEGFQVPVITFNDVVGNIGTAPPAQIVNEVPKLKLGVIFGLTVTVKVVGKAQRPASGVNV